MFSQNFSVFRRYFTLFWPCWNETKRYFIIFWFHWNSSSFHFIRLAKDFSKKTIDFCPFRTLFTQISHNYRKNRTILTLYAFKNHEQMTSGLQILNVRGVIAVWFLDKQATFFVFIYCFYSFFILFIFIQNPPLQIAFCH